MVLFISVQSPADLLEIYFGMPQARYVSSGGYGITANYGSKLHYCMLKGFNSFRKSGADRDFCLRAKVRGSVLYNDKSSVSHQPVVGMSSQ